MKNTRYLASKIIKVTVAQPAIASYLASLIYCFGNQSSLKNISLASKLDP